MIPFLVILVYLISDALLERTLASILGLALTEEHSDLSQCGSLKIEKLAKNTTDKLAQKHSI